MHGALTRITTRQGSRHRAASGTHETISGSPTSKCAYRAFERLPALPMSPLEFHILLALADASLHGYAIAEAIVEESAGTIVPRPGSLYRVIARLQGSGLVDETEPPADAPAHPGKERRYYALTRAGRTALAAESRRLKGALALAGKRLGTAEGR